MNAIKEFDWVNDTPEHGFSIVIDGVRHSGKSHALGSDTEKMGPICLPITNQQGCEQADCVWSTM